jgi:predicted DNA-binding helix-hairpin-helix protein
LLRDYGFDVEELPFETDGCLPTQTDPKMAWAQKNLADTPTEINRADRQALMRVPGIGAKGAESILRARRQNKIRNLSDLHKLGILAERASPYLLLDGRRPSFQPHLF